MKKLKKYKTDLLIILLFSLIYLVITFVLTKGNFYFASKVDFENQHLLFPEYFRNLFLENHDLLPDFAFNLGGGQNIYNFSYYGLLNPFILLSYLFKNVEMLDYLLVISFLTTITSSYLFYKFLLSNKLKHQTSLTGSLLFLFATPIIFHAKRHLMFVSYFPFLLLSLFGVDHLINKNKKILLIISITLMIFTSFYYSVSSLVVIGIYFLYKLFIYKEEKKLKLNDLIKPFLTFTCSVIISLLITAILWLPTLYTLLAGRAESIKELSFLKLIIPNFTFLYSSYGLGLTIIEFLIIIFLTLNKKIRLETRLLGLTLIIIFIFPVFNYFLNGTLYINTKSLIPFLPLAIFLVVKGIDVLFKHKKLLQSYLIFSTCLITIIVSSTDKLIPKKELKTTNQSYQTLLEKLEREDKSLYRITNDLSDYTSLNKVHSLTEYKSSIYSSIQNKNYYAWLKDNLKTNQAYRNNLMTTTSGNKLGEALMGEKYLISNKEKTAYKKIMTYKDLTLYQNDLALPVIYGTTTNLTKSAYQKLKYPENLITSYTRDLDSLKYLEEVTPEDFTKTMIKNLKVEEKDKKLLIEAKKNGKMVLETNNNFEDKILFISFKNNYNSLCTKDKNDQLIKINGITNKLTCSGWKYHNNNYIFHYVLESPNKLEIKFNPGTYKLDDLKIYQLPISILEKRKQEITEFKYNKEKTKADTISGTINLEKTSNLEIAIPYDKGFKIKVNSHEVKYQKSIQEGITLKLEKGLNKIDITYEAPLKESAELISLLGLLLLIFSNLKIKRIGEKYVKTKKRI